MPKSIVAVAIFLTVVLVVVNFYLYIIEQHNNSNIQPDQNTSSTPAQQPTSTFTFTSTPSPTIPPQLPPSTCKSDCLLYPVNKEYKLAADYTPTLGPTSNTTGAILVPEAQTQLDQLFTNAKTAGVDPVVVSSYRSYKQQEDTFNYWVNYEMAAGFSREVAIQRANTYSAMPGHSEHQLGSAVDLKCRSCEAFVESPANKTLYQFIEQNAHLYGFVISYPQGKQALTGYKYEPWHIRYIGADLAKQIYTLNYLDQNNQTTLQSFLVKNWQQN